MGQGLSDSAQSADGWWSEDDDDVPAHSVLADDDASPGVASPASDEASPLLSPSKGRAGSKRRALLAGSPSHRQALLASCVHPCVNVCARVPFELPRVL